jgi:hypothetical protein
MIHIRIRRILTLRILTFNHHFRRGSMTRMTPGGARLRRRPGARGSAVLM